MGRRLLDVVRRNSKRIVFAGVLATAIGFFCLSLIDPAPSSSRQPRGYPQLVSVRQLPDYSDACQCEPEGSSLRRLEEAYRSTLQERSVQATSLWSVFDDGDVPRRWRIPVKQISGLNVNGICSIRLTRNSWFQRAKGKHGHDVLLSGNILSATLL